MVKKKRIKSSFEPLFNSLCSVGANTVNNAICKAIHLAAVDLYSVLETAEDWLKADYSLTINVLEANGEWLGAQVSSAVINELKQAAGENDAVISENEKSTQGLKLDKLSLVAKDEFEDWLIANMSVKFLESELASELLTAAQILACLTGQVSDYKRCALGPESIIRALKQSIDTLEIPPAPQSMLYKTVSRSLFSDLKSLYQTIERDAEIAGLNYRAVKKPGNTHNSGLDAGAGPISNSIVAGEQSLDTGSDKASASLHQAGNAGISESPYSESTYVSRPFNQGPDYPASQGVPQQISTLNTLSRLKTAVSSGGKLGASARHAYSDSGPDIRAVHSHDLDAGLSSKSNFVTTISSLQKTYGDSSSDYEQRSLRHWIETSLKYAQIDKQTIGSEESEIIDVTDRFFDVIVEKIGVSSLLKHWLEKLKLTILKVVLRDESFFSDVNHPARQMLNKLAKLAANDRSGNKRLEKVLDQYIQRVVEEYDEDTQVFHAVVAELDTLIERQNLATRRNSERIARVYEGKQKIAEARHLVVEDINTLIAGKSVPVVLMELLDKAGWREQLVLALVRDGHNSESYAEVYTIVEQLMAWLTDDPDSSEHWALELEMEMEAPSLLGLVTREFEATGNTSAEPILKRLEDCLFNDVDPLLVKIERYDWPFENSEKDLEELSAQNSAVGASSHWHKRIVSLKIGDWIELKREDGKVRCLRLAWSGSESFRFVFVDSQGMKDVDVSLSELVTMFKENRAHFVEHDEVSLVDQGLHQMVQSVYEELSGQSSCDVLTGLLNRQAFERGLEQSIAGAITNKTKASLLYIDLDKFNVTNNTYGHHAGDALLKHVAHIIRNQGIENAFCGRLGGNEFGMILTNCSQETTLDIANCICSEVESSVFNWEEHAINATVSIGMVAFDIKSDSPESIMRKAGLACDSAKSQGRNRVLVYEEQDKDQNKRVEMLQWVQRLDQSLDDLLTLRCQEIRPVTPKKGTLSHYEILLGVRYEGQVIPPGMLIEAAEHYGRMARVDRWVLHNVLEWMENNPDIVKKSDGFSINLSGNSMSDDSFLEYILGEFAASTVSPEMICFEITETAAITNLADASEFISVLKQTGCKFSLDDFGSGLSSYAYIQKLPVDYIKIDGIFIRNLAINDQDKALVKSINELAHFMGMKTVAEFVENNEILNVLKELGVDHSQGFGIKKPGLLKDLS